MKREEVSYFAKPELDEPSDRLDEYEHPQHFSIASLSFKEGNKWRLSDGENVYNVQIKDEKFLERVNSNLETFAKDDILKVRLKTTRQLGPDGKLKTEHVIPEVLEHRSATRISQLPLPIKHEGESSTD